MSGLLQGDHTKSIGVSDPEEPAFNIVKLNNNLFTNASNNHRTQEEWLNIVPGSAFFEGVDAVIGKIIIMVYEDPDSAKISTVLFSALGEMCFNSLTLDNRSRFFAACENLKEDLKKSNVRRALAVTLLKTYGSLTGDLKTILTRSSPIEDWDETIAGELASTMNLISGQTPSQIGEKLMSLGFLQPHLVESTVLDVIYEDDPEIIEANNELVYLLGEQIEQLFDPLTEYSPENKINSYEVPEVNNNKDDGLTASICSELLKFQENTTHVLINFLQDFVIPLRMKVLNGEIKGLNITKLNQIFPPTIDEVTRVNCILLEALQKAVPYGSFEVVKACGTTIPYFYKAYMRHESAMKSFSHMTKGFRYEFSIDLQPQFSERRIESIMNASLNLTKIKLILERLINIKNWDTEENNQVRIYHKNSVETIDSFAREDLKPYSKRIFTPSGKVLTEICDGIPPLLTYGWLNRKVVCVVDAENLTSNENDVIIIFNDYAIFASVDEDEVGNHNADSVKPHVSDILMNSLMNEKPMKNIPHLKILCYSKVNDFEVTTFGTNCVKIILREKPQETLIYKVENSTKFVSLLNKAKILNKSTPFHLFKNVEFGFTIYSAAHERKVFNHEISKSSIAVFLNIDVDEQVLETYNLFAALSAKFVDEDMIRVQGLTVSGERSHYTINSSEFSSFVSEKLSALEFQRHSYKNYDLLKITLASNASLLDSVNKPISPPPSKDSIQRRQTRRSSELSRKSSRRISASSCNKPLPKIIDNPTPKKDEKELQKSKPKKAYLKNRLSQIFASKKPKQDITNTIIGSAQAPIMANAQTKEISPAASIRQDVQDTASEYEEGNISMDDCITFESSMTPIFDDTDDIANLENVQSLDIGIKSENWLLARDNSSKNFGLHLNNNSSTEPQPVVPEGRHIEVANQGIQGGHLVKSQQKQSMENKVDDVSVNNIKERPTAASQINNKKQNLSTPITARKLPTFNSLDDEFRTPILRVGYESVEDLNANDKDDDDVFYTPKSFGDDFSELESMESSLSQKFNGITAKSTSINNSLANFQNKDFGDPREHISDSTTSEPVKETINSSPSVDTIDHFDMNSLIWKSPSQFNFSEIYEEGNELANDDSFGYLAGVLDNSCVITEGMKNSETYKTLPRSYSSIKYLAAYIDNDTPISRELYDFLEE